MAQGEQCHQRQRSIEHPQSDYSNNNRHLFFLKLSQYPCIKIIIKSLQFIVEKECFDVGNIIYLSFP